MNGIYQRFLESKGSQTEIEAISMFNEFIKLLKEKENFRQYKKDQLAEYPETLSELEQFIFELISKSQSNKLEYDPINPIQYANDIQIKETLKSLFFGKLIHQMLELPEMKFVKERQKVPGQIASIDKEFIIKKIQSVALKPDALEQLESIIEAQYVKVKMAILFGNEDTAFAPYIGYNTNISAKEIIGIKAPNEKNYQDFIDMINKAKGNGGPQKKI